LSFVIGHWSFVLLAQAKSKLRQVGAGLFTSGCNRKDSSETRPYTIFLIFPISPISPPHLCPNIFLMREVKMHRAYHA